MGAKWRRCSLILALLWTSLLTATLSIGVGQREITPPLGSPSAGYSGRAGMEGILDPLYATALLIDNGEKSVVFCAVDHLGFTHEMAEEVMRRVHSFPECSFLSIYIGSSHTHAGGGGYLNIPYLGEMLAGKYDQSLVELYIQGTVDAIIEAYHDQREGRIGFGYGDAPLVSKYRGTWPENIEPLREIMVIKLVDLEGNPIATLCNYPMHPTILKGSNKLFSADFVGCMRDYLEERIGGDILYYNGAQGDIIPDVREEERNEEGCERIGEALGAAIVDIWDQISTQDTCAIQTKKHEYVLIPKPTPSGLTFPIKEYPTEVNVLIFNEENVFVTIPGELSTLYDRQLKNLSSELGFLHLSVLGLVNDAHGYIISPESWRHKTFESHLSFGGEEYGESVIDSITALLKD